MQSKATWRREKALASLGAKDPIKEDGMRRLMPIALAVLAAGVVGSSVAWAGNPHFVTVSAARTDNSLIVSGKEAGLGDEEQVHIVVNATAECINKGNHHPKAENKESVSSEGTFPVQNGKANFSLTLTAAFQPECSPPMTVVFTNVTVADTTNNLFVTLTGTF
jgi:hypothetical protein